MHWWKGASIKSAGHFMTKHLFSPSGGRTLGGAFRLATVAVRVVVAPGSAGAGLGALTESVACSA